MNTLTTVCQATIIEANITISGGHGMKGPENC